jgi:hypothetical protein
MVTRPQKPTQRVSIAVASSTTWTRSGVRLAALVAIAGGLLRAAASFAPMAISSDRGRESLYVVVDVCLAVGLLGWWTRRAVGLRRQGVFGLVMALAGIVAIRANHFITLVDLYPAGALAVASGMIVVSVSAWIVHTLPGWVPVMFLLSLLLGVVGSVVKDASVLFVCSGVMFGVAFVRVGVDTWLSADA